MEEKVIRLTNAVESYKKLAMERAKNGDYVGALGFLFTAKDMSNDVEILADIADVYTDMGALDLSAKYWFYYLDKAPSEKHGTAYEELAINFFYMDDFLASSYYFHKKITTDGFISQDGLDPDIIDFFSGEKRKLAKYKIAYPFDRADYTEEIKDAKHAIANGSFKEAVDLYKVIPTELLTEETAGEYSISCMMAGDYDKAIEICNSSIERDGESITAYCNLSTVYDMKGDKEKGDYYYRKALSLRCGDRSEVYKIVTCALEREEHSVIKECLGQIVEERPFDLSMRFFYALALINTGNLNLAEEILFENYRIDRKDFFYKFYANLISSLIREEKWATSLLPLKYVKEIPETIEKKYIKSINELVNNPDKIALKLKNKEVREILEWGLSTKEGRIVRKSAYVLSTAYTPFAKKMMLEALLDKDALPDLKRVLIYGLIVNGYTDRFSILLGNYFTKMKPKKLKVDDKNYLTAYALCMSRLIFFDLGNLDKIHKITMKIHSKLSKILSPSDVTADELAALIVGECGYERFSTDEELFKVFPVEKRKLDALRNLLKGEKDDKDDRR